MLQIEQGCETTINLTVNGEAVQGRATPRTLLSDFLRHELGFTGTHVGCEHGVCGACTVRVDGLCVRSCLYLAVQVDGCNIQTIEGLARTSTTDSLHPLQAAFKRHHALQCGFCTAGILMSMSELLESDEAIDEARVREQLSGHLCRCTGYTPIIAAVLDAARERQRPESR